jgi:hypothetical protein
MKGLGAKYIHTKLFRVLGDDCSRPAAIERWLARFHEGDLSSANHFRSGRLVIDISEYLHAALEKFPFVSANMMSKHFRRMHGTVMEILQRHLVIKSSRVDRCYISSDHHKS